MIRITGGLVNKEVHKHSMILLKMQHGISELRRAALPALIAALLLLPASPLRADGYTFLGRMRTTMCCA
jgi:hypothetical protein